MRSLKLGGSNGHWQRLGEAIVVVERRRELMLARLADHQVDFLLNVAFIVYLVESDAENARHFAGLVGEHDVDAEALAILVESLLGLVLLNALPVQVLDLVSEDDLVNLFNALVVLGFRYRIERRLVLHVLADLELVAEISVLLHAQNFVTEGNGLLEQFTDVQVEVSLLQQLVDVVLELLRGYERRENHGEVRHLVVDFSLVTFVLLVDRLAFGSCLNESAEVDLPFVTMIEHLELEGLAEGVSEHVVGDFVRLLANVLINCLHEVSDHRLFGTLEHFSCVFFISRLSNDSHRDEDDVEEENEEHIDLIILFEEEARDGEVD